MTVSLLAVNMLQDTAIRERVEVLREEDRDNVFVTVPAGAATESTRMDLGPLPSWTLDKYCNESAGLMDVKHLDAMAVDGGNLVV